VSDPTILELMRERMQVIARDCPPQGAALFASGPEMARAMRETFPHMTVVNLLDRSVSLPPIMEAFTVNLDELGLGEPDDVSAGSFAPPS
jgi:hypothetical protein